MSHRNSKKSNRIGQSVQKHRAQRNNPFEAEDRPSLERKIIKELSNFTSRLPSTQPTSEDSPQRASGIPASVPSPSPDSPSDLSTLTLQLASSPSLASSSDLSTLKSEIAPSPSDSAPASPSEPSSPSASPISCVTDTDPLSRAPESPSDFEAAKAFIASKPATKAMHQLQHLLDTRNFDFTNPKEVAELSQLMVVYAQLQNSSAVERIIEALEQVGVGYKREALLRELSKVLSIQDRALARALREKDSIAKEQRRIEREAKREQAQAARQLREERLFNQREDHMKRKEKIAQKDLDTALYNRANHLRDQLNKTAPAPAPSPSPSHRQGSTPQSQGANLDPQSAESQTATFSSSAAPSAP